MEHNKIIEAIVDIVIIISVSLVIMGVTSVIINYFSK